METKRRQRILERLILLTLGLLGVVGLAGCDSPALERGSIERMTISQNDPHGQGDAVTIANPETIAEIVRGVEGSVKRPIKFRPAYWLELVYRDGTTRSVGVSGDAIKIDGRSYQAFSNVEDRIRRALEGPR